MSDIPTEVVIEILCCLPVKSLLKFRCVCKSWKARIDSPTFAKMHLKNSEIKPKLMICGRSLWCDVSFDLLDAQTQTQTQTCSESTMVTHNYPSKIAKCPATVMGYCNGLLLVTCGSIYSLWNPSTRNHIELPDFERKLKVGWNLFKYECGFGYDKITDDYKVIRILQVFGENLSKAVVYSLKSRSYRRIKECPFYIVQVGGGIFVFDALHWIVMLPSDKYMVVAFNLESEEYKLVDLPLHLRAPELKRLTLGVFEGCLSLSCSYKCGDLDIWLLRDPINKESWSKFISLKVEVKENIIPISYTKCGKYVILEKDEEQLLFFDLVLKSMRKIPIILGSTTFNTFLFAESFEVNNLGGGVVSKTNQAEEKQTTKKRARDDFLSTGFRLKL